MGVKRGYQPMKMLAFLLAIICAVAAIMYYTMPAGQLPTFMPGHVAGSSLIHMKHAIAAAAAAIVFLIIGLFVGRRTA
jgi:di/tricarboxylate transporter